MKFSLYGRARVLERPCAGMQMSKIDEWRLHIWWPTISVFGLKHDVFNLFNFMNSIFYKNEKKNISK